MTTAILFVFCIINLTIFVWSHRVVRQILNDSHIKPESDEPAPGCLHGGDELDFAAQEVINGATGTITPIHTPEEPESPVFGIPDWVHELAETNMPNRIKEITLYFEYDRFATGRIYFKSPAIPIREFYIQQPVEESTTTPKGA